MKLLHKILGIGSLGLVIALPLVNQAPVSASFPQLQEIIAQVSPAPQIQLNLTAAKKSIVVSSGAEQQVAWEEISDGTVVNPGDILRYTVSSANPNAATVNDLNITQPIPDKMVYELDTATGNNGATIVYSIDNGETFVAQPTITIETENGETRETPAPAETYTHIRWQFGSIAPTADIAATYEVKVQ